MLNLSRKSSSELWIKRLRPAARAQFRLFCFPSAGANAASYLPWSAAVSPHIEVFALQLPGRGERFREPPTAVMSEILEALAQATRPLCDRPFVFFGHSLGALIAFELTRALRRESERLPLHLFVAARRAPQTPQVDPPVHQLPDQDFLSELRRLGGMAPEILAEQDFMELLMPSLRADFAIHETYSYTPQPPLACPITACGGSNDPEVSPEDLAAWREQTASQFELHIFPGGHFFVDAHRERLIAMIETHFGLHSLPFNNQPGALA